MHHPSTGLAAPAIAAGFSALAPTLGTIIPVIGASGFAAVATAAGSVAGSVAVAASFGGEYITTFVGYFSSSLVLDVSSHKQQRNSSRSEQTLIAPTSSMSLAKLF